MLTVSDYATLEQAVNALEDGGELVFPPGTYTLKNPLAFTNLDNIRLVGFGATITSTARLASFFSFIGCSNVRIDGLAFDMGMDHLPTYTSRDYPNLYNVAIHCTAACDGIAVERCSFSQLYTAAIYFKESSSLRVAHCDFASPVQEQDQHLEFILLQTFAGNSEVCNNGFNGAAMTRPDRSPSAVAMSSCWGHISIYNNRAQWCGRDNTGAHRLGVFDLYADCKNVTIRDNEAFDCLEQFARLSTCVDVNLTGNTVTISQYASTSPAYSAISVESGSFTDVANPVCKRIRIENNSITDLANRQAYMIGIIAYDWGAAPIDVRVTGNRLTGSERAFYVSGPFNGLEISRNAVRDVEVLIETALGRGLTSKLGAQRGASFERLVLDDNDAVIRAGSAKVPITFSTHAATPFAGSVGEAHANRNHLLCEAPGTTIAINVIFNARTAEGVFVARDNLIEGYTTPFLIRSIKGAVLTDNQIPGFTTLLNSNSSNYGTLEALGNHKSVRTVRKSA